VTNDQAHVKENSRARNFRSASKDSEGEEMSTQESLDALAKEIEAFDECSIEEFGRTSYLSVSGNSFSRLIELVPPFLWDSNDDEREEIDNETPFECAIGKLKRLALETLRTIDVYERGVKEERERTNGMIVLDRDSYKEHLADEYERGKKEGSTNREKEIYSSIVQIAENNCSGRVVPTLIKPGDWLCILTGEDHCRREKESYERGKVEGIEAQLAQKGAVLTPCVCGDDERIADAAKIVSINGLSTEQATSFVDIMSLREKFAKQAEAEAYERGKKEGYGEGEDYMCNMLLSFADCGNPIVKRGKNLYIYTQQGRVDRDLENYRNGIKTGHEESQIAITEAKAEGIAEGRELEKADVLRLMRIGCAGSMRGVIEDNAHRTEEN